MASDRNLLASCCYYSGPVLHPNRIRIEDAFSIALWSICSRSYNCFPLSRRCI